MAKLANLARMTTATTGTGTISLGAAAPGYLTFAQAGLSSGDIVDYAITDGNNSEHGRGVYTTGSPPTLTRSVVNSTNSNAAINLSGTAEVFISPLADTLQVQCTATVFTSSGTFTTPSDSTALTVYRYRMIAGGGGGGGSNGSSAAGAGGAGAYAEGTFSGVAPNTAINITVGAGGTPGGVAGTGGLGGSTSIGAPVSVTCGPGSPGAGSGGGSVTLPGAGGTISGSPNILSMNGARGEPGVSTITANIVRGGRGAGTPFGDGGEPGMPSIGTSGIAPTSAWGAGGGGGCGNSGSGGAGRQGIVIIERVSG